MRVIRISLHVFWVLRRRCSQHSFGENKGFCTFLPIYHSKNSQYCVRVRQIERAFLWPHYVFSRPQPNINAQRGIARSSIKQDIPFYSPMFPVFTSLHSEKPPSFPPSLQPFFPFFHILLKGFLAGALLWTQTNSAPTLPQNKANLVEGKNSIGKKWCRRNDKVNLKKQQLQQTYCHLNICFMLSAAAGQFTAGSAPLGILSGMALCPHLQFIS